MAPPVGMLMGSPGDVDGSMCGKSRISGDYEQLMKIMGRYRHDNVI